MIVTVCTPTYNRVECLGKLYRSLQSQTNKSFEWVVVDDGSEDRTEEVVRQWIDGADFEIRYIGKTNGGKHTAINVGVENAKGDCFIIVDSDDALSPDAIETIIAVFSDLPKDGFAGAGFNKLFSNGDIIGTTFAGEYIDATTLERPKFKITGDKAEVFWTDILKLYPFPVFEGERFLTEALVWNRIADAGYKLRWYNKGIYFCEYRTDGLSMNVPSFNNLEGYTLYIKELLTYRQLTLKEKTRWLGVYASVAAQKGFTTAQTARRVGAPLAFVLFAKTLYGLKQTIRPTERTKSLRINT